MALVCELGEKLKAARERLGLGLEELAQRSGLSESYLEALEACDTARLPEPALVRAHLRRLAKFLGLNPEELAALYPGGEARPVPRAKAAAPARRRPAWIWLFLAVLALVLAAYGAYHFRPQPENPPPAAESTPPPEVPKKPERVRLVVETEPEGAKVYLDGYYLGPGPVEILVEPGERVLKVEAEGYKPFEKTIEITEDANIKVALEKIPEEKPKEEQEAAKPNTITLKVTAKSWLRVTTPEGKKLYEKTAEPGTELVFDLPVVVRTGNAGGVRVIIGGEDQGPMGKPGEVLTREFPAQ